MKSVLLKNKWYFIFLIVLMIAEPSINSVLNFWMQRLFNSTKPGIDKLFLMRLLTQGFLFWMGKRLISFASSAFKTRFICNAKRDIKHSLFKRLMIIDESSLLDYSGSGDYISIFTNDISLIEQRYFNQVVGFCSSVFSIVILGGSFFALNRKLAVPILIFGLITMFIPLLFSHRLNQQNIRYSDTISHFTQRLKDYILAFPTIRNYTAENRIQEQFDNENQRVEDSKFDADFELNLANNIGQLMAWFMQFLCVGIGLMLVADGEIMLGTVIAAQGFANDLGSPLQNLLISINNIRSVNKLVKKINTLTERKSEQDGKLHDEAFIAAEGPVSYDIAFQHVGLSWGQKAIVRDFSFTFQEGKKYLIVGKNGSGKSSVFKILKRWYHDVEGSITIGGTDIRGMDNATLNQCVSYLNERVNLFSASVYDNITLFQPTNSDILKKVIQDAKVELSLDRQIEDEGRNISSGEQRRIEIARTLLSSTKVIVLDEVISTLDIQTAYEIEKLVLSLQEKTIVLISHNFSGLLIRQYDEILVMDNGQLIDHGPFEELREHCPYFKQICKVKFGDET